MGLVHTVWLTGARPFATADLWAALRACRMDHTTRSHTYSHRQRIHLLTREPSCGLRFARHPAGVCDHVPLCARPTRHPPLCAACFFRPTHTACSFATRRSPLAAAAVRPRTLSAVPIQRTATPLDGSVLAQTDRSSRRAIRYACPPTRRSSGSTLASSTRGTACSCSCSRRAR
jgi:hypothetical protein